MPKKISFPLKRRQARQAALQALYQWQVTHQDISSIEKQFKINYYHTDNSETTTIDVAYFSELIKGVIENTDIINQYIKRYTNRPLAEIDMIELNILRIVTFELISKLDIPPKVILNEALELAKLFGGTEGYKFINGIGDKIAREVRKMDKPS